MKKTGEPLKKLMDIVAMLRGPNGCPWDKEQTYKDINPYLLEEAHEIVEAIDKNDFQGLKEELGDLLVHILFHCQMATEDGKFDMAEVMQNASDKLIRRHPHVFGDDKASDSANSSNLLRGLAKPNLAPTTQEVLVNWEKIKQEENKHKRESILEGIPKTIPALIKALRLGEKSSRVGFDWPDRKGIMLKLHEELEELKEAMKAKDPANIEREYGDLLFTMANLGRFLKLDPESSLRKASDTFTTRFQWIEKKAKQNGEILQNLTPEKWDKLWNEAKTHFKTSS
ncbi:MAG: nucleoside triphosphate pyrophosphohydrolase [Deltaproteobacteria bacterium]|nr:nucleoside triphosphate pyrophosphohydrolase [Deltaproteobacteria bacterium]